jgi:hypothetical protein
VRGYNFEPAACFKQEIIIITDVRSLPLDWGFFCLLYGQLTGQAFR